MEVYKGSVTMGNRGSHPGSLPQEYMYFTNEPPGYPGVGVAQVWTKYGDQVTAADGHLLRAHKHCILDICEVLSFSHYPERWTLLWTHRDFQWLAQGDKATR